MCEKLYIYKYHMPPVYFEYREDVMYKNSVNYQTFRNLFDGLEDKLKLLK